MALRGILTDEDAALRKRSREETDIADRVLALVDDMIETMRDAGGIGLAAPQIGVLRRIITVELDDELYVLINPEILKMSGEQCEEEACLSVPGLIGRVNRPETVRIAGLSPDGERVEYEGSGLLAVAVCHECDHLDGILFTDKASQVHRPDETFESDDSMGETELGVDAQ